MCEPRQNLGSHLSPDQVADRIMSYILAGCFRPTLYAIIANWYTILEIWSSIVFSGPFHCWCSFESINKCLLTQKASHCWYHLCCSDPWSHLWVPFSWWRHKIQHFVLYFGWDASEVLRVPKLRRGSLSGPCMCRECSLKFVPYTPHWPQPSPSPAWMEISRLMPSSPPSPISSWIL